MSFSWPSSNLSLQVNSHTPTTLTTNAWKADFSGSRAKLGVKGFPNMGQGEDFKNSDDCERAGCYLMAKKKLLVVHGLRKKVQRPQEQRP